MASGSDDRTALLWDVADRAHPRRLGEPLAGHDSPVLAVAFDHDGKTLATGSDDQSVLLWDVADPARPRRIGGPLAGPNGPVLAVAFSPDGGLLAVGSDDRTTLLWDLADRGNPRRLGAPLTGQDGPVAGVAFAPDGKTLATGGGEFEVGADGTVLLWDVAELQRVRRDLVGETCRRAGGLTEQEWARYIPDLPFHRVCP
jgi:WD40 repeat protein